MIPFSRYTVEFV